MNERRKSRGGGIVLLLACGVMLPVLYMAGYFGLGKFQQDYFTIWRIYPHTVFVHLYYPAALVEARLTGKLVIIDIHRDEEEEIELSVIEPSLSVIAESDAIQSVTWANVVNREAGWW